MQSTTPAPNTALPESVRSALWLFFALSVVCLIVELFCRFVLHLQYPYNWPLPPHENRFCDFLVYDERLRTFHSPAFFTRHDIPVFSYPPAAAAVLSIFYLTSRPLLCFLLTMILCLLGAAVLWGRILLKKGLSMRHAVVTVLFFGVSYPLLLDMQQANCEWIVWLVVASGLAAFIAEKPALAAFLLGLGAAIKLYPIILLGLFIPRRQYRWLAVSLAVCVVSSLGSMWLESGSIALSWTGTITGIAGLNKGYMLHPMEFWDHSLFEFFKGALALRYGNHLPPVDSQRIQRIYLLLMAVIGLVLFFARIRKMPLLNQIFALTIASVLLPPMSMDYTLIQLFLPCALLILSELRAARSGVTSSSAGTRAALLTMACLFAPLTELTLYGHTLSNTLRTVGLIVLFWISLKYPFETAQTIEEFDPITVARLAA